MSISVNKLRSVVADAGKTTREHVTDGFVTFSDDDEKRYNRAVNRKLDLVMLPFLSFLYLFSGLDRGNIGNAETQGKMVETRKNSFHD
jgi:hypothetical protein